MVRAGRAAVTTAGNRAEPHSMVRRRTRGREGRRLQGPASARVNGRSCIPLVELEVIDAKGIALPSCLSLKSCTRTRSGWPFRCHSRPAFLKSPTSSFFLVSTLITGQPAATAAVAGGGGAANWRHGPGERPFLGLHVGLQRVAQQPHERRDRREVHLEAHLAQRAGDLPHTLRRPAQQRLRVPTRS